MFGEERDWITDESGSLSSFLSIGCEICMKGAGLVLFVTGLCERSCFYCPLSSARKGIDVVYANEKRVTALDDILDEAHAVDALGTGITGGEPLLKLDYVIECIRFLKRSQGDQHHIHLYTGCLPGTNALKSLKGAGLDEIRFHPALPLSDPDRLLAALRESTGLGMQAGVEIPAIAPEPVVLEAVRRADAFLNINELEFSETNQAALLSRGFVQGEMYCEAIGSREIALRHLMESGMKVHFCSSGFKDSVQLRRRLLRRCRNVARSFDLITEDGTLIYAEVSPAGTALLELLARMGVPAELYQVGDLSAEMAEYVAEEIAEELRGRGYQVFAVERYPMEGGLVVERIPL